MQEDEAPTFFLGYNNQNHSISRSGRLSEIASDAIYAFNFGLKTPN